MAPITIISIAMVLLGIGLMSAAINGGFRLNHDLPVELRSRWQLMTVFMILFDVGYIVFVSLLLSEIHFPIELLVGLILLGGAIFVLMFVKQTEFTIRRMNELRRDGALANEKLRESNARLVEEVREREKIGAELSRSKTHLKNVLNNSIPLCLTNTDFEIVEANDVYYRNFGNPPAKPVRQKCYESRPGPSCETDDCLLIRILAGESEVLCESEKIYGDGVRHRFLVTARPWINEDGEIAGIVESFQDITRLKLAEEALAEEKERLQVTLGSIADGVVTVDLDGRVLLINDTAQSMTGWRQAEAAGKVLDEVLHLIEAGNHKKKIDLMGQLAAAVNSPVEQKGGTEGRAILVAGGGAERQIHYSLSPIHDKRGGVYGTVLVFQDITGKLKIEQESVRIGKLESVSLLASGIAHDFNNILTAVMNNLTLARMVRDSEDKLLEKIDSTEEAVLRARELTHQLLTFAKGGASAREMVAFGDLVKNSVEFSLRGSNVRSAISVAEDLRPVEVDEVQMHQVISNLVINADQAMPDGGVLTISLTNCVFSPGESPLVKEGSYVKLTIRDQGAGIGEEHLARIFDPYFTTKPEGSGLGLATVYSIIFKHGGYVFVDSEQGKGAEFTIYLPAAEGKKGGGAASAGSGEKAGGAERPSVRGGKILIMDDEADIRDLLGELLHNAGFKVVAVRDGEEALRIYREVMDSEERFDCVIMDLTIPGGMGGRETIERLLRTDPRARAIVSSGYANDPVMLDYARYGFLGRVAKPYRLEVLLETLNEVIGGGG